MGISLRKGGNVSLSKAGEVLSTSSQLVSVGMNVSRMEQTLTWMLQHFA